ncbi:MAG: hypothetical protein JJT96_14140 [Opitutales bacterium]|nr:hypothetical protein [Opitutales bacterium]
MKATFEIPDDLYRRVKARSALEGRPLRSVALELFQNWLNAPEQPTDSQEDRPSPAEIEKFPWLQITRPYIREGMSHDLDEMREAIARGWGAEAAAKNHRGKSAE